MWDDITYSVPNFSAITVEVWINHFIPHFIMYAITYPCWDNHAWHCCDYIATPIIWRNVCVALSSQSKLGPKKVGMPAASLVWFYKWGWFLVVIMVDENSLEYRMHMIKSTETRSQFQCRVRPLIEWPRNVSTIGVFQSRGNLLRILTISCQISKRYVQLNTRSRGLDTLRHFTISRLMRYWNGPSITKLVWRTVG